MSIETKIISSEGDRIGVGIRTTETYGNGMKVYSYEGDKLANNGAFFTNNTFGSNLNQNVTAGGTPVGVYNGGDSVLWTASTPVGTAGSFLETSTVQAHTGTRSLDASPSVDGDTIQFARGSNLTLASYQALTGWIYLTSWSNKGTKQVLIYGWDVGLGLQVGTALDIGSYINITNLNVWQKFTIPFADFGFTAPTLNAVRIRTVDIGAGNPPDYFIDDLQFEETGTSLIYSAGPEFGEKWEVKSLSYTMADAFAGTVTNGTMPNIPYNGFLGVSTLTNGILIRRIQGSNIIFQQVVKDFIDMVATPAPRTLISGCDGTNTWFRLDSLYPFSYTLDGDKQDRIEIVIRDDLSGLLFFKSSIVYAEHVDIE